MVFPLSGVMAADKERQIDGLDGGVGDESKIPGLGCLSVGCRNRDGVYLDCLATGGEVNAEDSQAALGGEFEVDLGPFVVFEFEGNGSDVG